MLARTSTLAILACFAAVVVASPLPGGDGEDIRFIEIKKFNDDKFKKTKFNVHDATEHDKNFNQIDAKNKNVLKAVDFRKDDDDFFLVKRADAFVNSLDLREAAGFNFKIDLANEIGLNTDLNFDRFRRIDDVNDIGILRKRWDGGDGEDIRFIEVKAIDEDRFKKTNFNVHDRTEHDKNFNQVEAKDRDVLKVVDFRKDDDDFGIFKRGIDTGFFLFGDSPLIGLGVDSSVVGSSFGDSSFIDDCSFGIGC